MGVGRDAPQTCMKDVPDLRLQLWFLMGKARGRRTRAKLINQILSIPDSGQPYLPVAIAALSISSAVSFGCDVMAT